MAYDVSSFLDSLKATLVANASTLSTSLTVNYPTLTTDSIHIGNPLRVVKAVDEYPAIILTPKTKTAQFDEIGYASSKVARQLINNVDILCLTQCMSDDEDADKQARTLARNVEAVLDTNVEKVATTSTVSDGWNMAIVTNAIYDGAYSESTQTYQSSVRLEAEFTSWGVR